MWREISARAWERKKEIAFFYPFEYYYYSVVFSQKSHQSVFSSVKVFCCCCCSLLKSGSIKIIKIKCKKKAPNKKIVTKKKAKRHSLRAPFKRAFGERHRTRKSRRVQTSCGFGPLLAVRGGTGFCRPRFLLPRASRSKDARPHVPSSRDFSAFVSAFGWMDRF